MTYHLSGFNYAYRRTVTPSTVAPTPSSATSALPAAGVASGTAATPVLSTKGSGTPVTPAEKSLPPHLNPSKSKPSTPPPNSAGSGRETPKDSRPNGAGTPHSAADKAERERVKREKKKERKQQERAEREAATKDGLSNPATPTLPESTSSPPPHQQVKSGKATPDIHADVKAADDGVTSPATESTGARTPTSSTLR